MNQVNLTGRLTKDIELRYTQSGKAVGTATIAVNRKFKSSNGEREADFINFVIWNKSAENLANYSGKGSLIGLSGEWQTRNYENNQGQRVYVNELIVSSFDLLETKQGSQSRSNQQNNYQSDNSAASPFSGNGPIEIDDNDLPF